MEQVDTKKSLWISIASGILAILIFLFILFVTYLPNQPESADAQQKIERYEKAELIRSEGISTLNALRLLDAQNSKYAIPVERAMELTIIEYQK